MQANVKGDMSPKICTDSLHLHGIKQRLTDQGKYQKVKVGIFLFTANFEKNKISNSIVALFFTSQTASWEFSLNTTNVSIKDITISGHYQFGLILNSDVIWWSPMYEHFFFAVCRNAVWIYLKL